MFFHVTSSASCFPAAERIRLNGIDCPEKNQAYGQKVKHATSALVFDKKVTILTYAKDKYEHTISEVLLPDETNVKHELVKEGWCWWYRKYAPGDTALEDLETEAREARRGLWAAPTRYRHGSGGRADDSDG